MVYLVSLTSFKIFSFITGFQQLDHAVSWHGFLCDYPVEMCWESWIDGFIVLIKFRNFSDFLQWKMFLGTTITYMLGFLVFSPMLIYSSFFLFLNFALKLVFNQAFQGRFT